MRMLGWVAILAAISGWSVWFAVCNIYEFAPALDPWAFGFGWLITLLACVQSSRSAQRWRWGWGLCGLASCFALYLLLIHRGVAAIGALPVLIISTALVLAWVVWPRSRHAAA